MDHPDLRRILLAIEEIPALPEISRQVEALLDDDRVPLGKLAEVIEKDVALAVRIVKFANSPFYGTLSRVSSIDHALAILGLREVRAILMAVSVSRVFPAAKGSKDFDRAGFWRHSVATSQIAKYLARQFRVGREDTLFFAGLIHDLGKLVLDEYLHSRFQAIIRTVVQQHTTFSKAEKETVGVAHYHIAAKLLQKWQFPVNILMPIFFHHAPWHDRNTGLLSTTLYLANILAKMAGCHTMTGEETLDPASFLKSPGFQHVVKSGFDLDRSSLAGLLANIRQMLAAGGDELLGVVG